MSFLKLKEPEMMVAIAELVNANIITIEEARKELGLSYSSEISTTGGPYKVVKSDGRETYGKSYSSTSSQYIGTEGTVTSTLPPKSIPKFSGEVGEIK